MTVPSTTPFARHLAVAGAAALAGLAVGTPRRPRGSDPQWAEA